MGARCRGNHRGNAKSEKSARLRRDQSQSRIRRLPAMKKVSAISLVLFAALALTSFPRASRGAAFSSQLNQVEDGTLKDVQGRSEEHTSELQSLRHLVCR